MMVRNALGYPSTDLGTLCTCDKVNKFSRYRPGYWYASGRELLFNTPKGGDYLDLRGADENGIDKQVFRLGDFRGYNSSAYPPSIGGDSEQTLKVQADYSLNTIPVEMTFNLGEVDWFNEEDKYRGMNKIPLCSNFIVCKSSEEDGVYTKVESISVSELMRSGNLKRAILEVSVPVPHTTDMVLTTYFKYGIGNGDHIVVFLPGVVKYNVEKNRLPSYDIMIHENNFTALKNSITNLRKEDRIDDIYRIDIIPSYGSFSVGASSVFIEQTNIVIEFRNSGNRYKIIEPRWRINGSVTHRETGATSTFRVVAALGVPGYMFTVNLPKTSEDGDQFDIKITGFESTGVVLLDNNQTP